MSINEDIDLDTVDVTAAPVPADPATTPQMAYARDLGKHLAELAQGDVTREQVVQWYRDLWPNMRANKTLMSSAIDGMKEFRSEWRALRTMEAVATPVEEPAEEESLEGMHRLDGEIYKVQRAVHGSGNLYAKVLVLGRTDCPTPRDGGCGCPSSESRCRGPLQTSFEYARGVIRRLSAETKMTLEQAKEWGALYGTCCVCGRTLTNEESIAAGIGPICAGKF